MATNVVSGAIVLEVLTKDNYANWSVCVKNYLLGQDLWDIVETESKPKFKTWRKKNAMTLHAIQISCGPDILSEIREISSAKDVWDRLAKMLEPQPQGGVSEPISSAGDLGTENSDFAQYEPLLEAVYHRDWEHVKSFLEEHSDAVRAKISSTGNTVLHVAVNAVIYWFPKMVLGQDRFKERFNKCVKIVEELVQRMSKEDLEIQNSENKTAFFLTANGGITQMAECMLGKNKNLVSIAGKKGLIPVAIASIKGHKDMVRYLYNATPQEELSPNIEGNINGATLVSSCLAYEIFDVAFHLLDKFPKLAFARDFNGSSPVLILSQTPSAFRSRTQLVFWKWWIYERIRVPKVHAPNGDFVIKIPKPHDQGQTDQVISTVLRVFGQLRGLLSKLFGIKQIYEFFDQLYDTKLIHGQACELLVKMAEGTSSSSSLRDPIQLKEGLVDKAISWNLLRMG